MLHAFAPMSTKELAINAGSSYGLNEFNLKVACVRDVKVTDPIGGFSTIRTLAVNRSQILDVKKPLDAEHFHEEPFCRSDVLHDPGDLARPKSERLDHA